MILYDFQCLDPECAHLFEAMAEVETRLLQCPECDLKAERLFPCPKVKTVYGGVSTFGGREPPPDPRMLDTRALADGQSTKEWKAERKKMWGDERKKDNGLVPQVYVGGKG